MNIENYLKPLALAAALAVATAAWAVPARPGVIEVTQPDGTRVPVTLHGDEYHNWTSTPDGYTLMRDAAGYLTFARAEGSAVKASDLRYTGAASVSKAAAGGFAKHLRPAMSARKAAAKSAATQVEGTFPAKGKRKLLMLLLNYADTQPKYTAESFGYFMNSVNFNGTGSFRDYYLENSYGQLDITTTVTRWITLSGSKSTYGADGAEAMIEEALTMLNGEIDLKEFDNDGDGVLDGLAVIHQGTGAEASGNPNEIWSHSGAIYGKSFDGVQLRRYTIQPELLDNGISTIGVMCHEFGHNLGAPDFYDTDYGLSGGEYPATGKWDLMASGAWNGKYGDRPAGTNMWQKIQLGWVTPEELTADRSIAGMKGSTFEPVAYRFDTTVPGEYFILENRQQEGRFDVAVPHHGLLIYHVSDNMIADRVVANTLNVTYPQSIWTVCAGSASDPNSSPISYGWVNSTDAPFPGGKGCTSFTDTTLPSTKSISGRYSYKGLTHIAEAADGTISFDFICYDQPGQPVNLAATARRGVVSLTWDAPQGEKPAKYNIYRNDKLLATVDAPGYTDEAIGSLTDLDYTVDAEYASGLVSPYSEVKVMIPGNHITALNVTTDGTDVTLQWNLNTQLTRMTNMGENFLMANYANSSVEMGHRYRADDLAVYRGYKISRVAFIPVQSQKEVKCTLTVYEADPASGTMTVASQRVLKEYGSSTWNNIKLTKTVEITGDKDIWITVKYESTNGTVQFLTDLGPAMSGYGNMVRLDGGEWKADDKLSGNIFLYATLTEPEAAEAAAPEIKPVTDPLADNAFPMAFAVYRDDMLLGNAGGRKYVDTAVPEGAHTYIVTNLYKGNNESAGVEQKANVTTDAVADLTGDAPAAGSVSAADGGIEISGVTGTVTIADIAGRIVAAIAARGTLTYVSLPAGVYVVTTPEATHKIAVK